MNNFAIQEQLEAIKNATNRASRTKETALQFLKDAGIVSEPKRDANSQRVTTPIKLSKKVHN